MKLSIKVRKFNMDKLRIIFYNKDGDEIGTIEYSFNNDYTDEGFRSLNLGDSIAECFLKQIHGIRLQRYGV